MSNHATDIRLEALSKSYGDNIVIPQLDAAFEAGRFTVILGPSGCGKSTLLNMIAGLERVSRGRILMGMREVHELAPKERGIAMVFQNYALYPHMSVAENIGYSLKIAGVPKADRQRRVAAAAETVALGNYLDRLPGQLSGGQRQRVAIARAIVREPSVLLFDEPLSNLDAQLRHTMRIELAQLHRRIGATSVFVTHDQVEAMTLADKIMILNNGEIEQYDTPDAIYRRPASTFVAGFIGSPPMNLLDAEVNDGMLTLPQTAALARVEAKGALTLGVRPEDVRIVDEGLPVTIEHVEDLGSHAILSTRMPDGQHLQLSAALGYRPALGESLHVQLPLQALHLFDTTSGRRMNVAVSALNKVMA